MQQIFALTTIAQRWPWVSTFFRRADTVLRPARDRDTMQDEDMVEYDGNQRSSSDLHFVITSQGLITQNPASTHHPCGYWS
jgi:hypothetical protein